MYVRSETVKDIKAGDKLMGHKIKGLALMFWLLKKNQISVEIRGKSLGHTCGQCYRYTVSSLKGFLVTLI